MEIWNGERLMNDLLGDLVRFHDEGRAYTLLQEYFSGLPVETLAPHHERN